MFFLIISTSSFQTVYGTINILNCTEELMLQIRLADPLFAHRVEKGTTDQGQEKEDRQLISTYTPLNHD